MRQAYYIDQPTTYTVAQNKKAPKCKLRGLYTVLKDYLVTLRSLIRASLPLAVRR